VGGRQTSARSQTYIKRTKWIISYKEVCGRRPRPTAPLVISVLPLLHFAWQHWCFPS